jgi:hypothetical protein
MNIKTNQEIDFEEFDFLELISKAFKQALRSEEYIEALKELTAKGVHQKAWLN